MFNENDLRFATERLKDLQAAAEQARRTAPRARAKRSSSSNPLWVQILNMVLDRSRWILVQKSAFDGGATAHMQIYLASSHTADCEAD